ncbi:hypothetical protein LSH36_418g02022, partial [Paralvinella palmiformis]
MKLEAVHLSPGDRTAADPGLPAATLDAARHRRALTSATEVGCLIFVWFFVDNDGAFLQYKYCLLYSTGVAQTGGKPLTMVNSVTRTTASPLSQPSPGTCITAASSNASLSAASRQSSFAAALRKLAKQAGDTDPHDNAKEVSPGSSALNAPAASSDKNQEANPLFSKSTAPSGTISGSRIGQSVSGSSQTTTPTPSHRPYLDNRKVFSIIEKLMKSSSEAVFGTGRKTYCGDNIDVTLLIQTANFPSVLLSYLCPRLDDINHGSEVVEPFT